MKNFLCRTPKFGVFFAIAFLVFQTAPATSADSAGSSTAMIGKERKIAFSDVYAFRAQDPSDKKKQVTVVVLSASPMDKKAMTAALRKERHVSAGMHLSNKEVYAHFWITQSGKIEYFGVFIGGGNQCIGRDLKSDVKVNTAKRVEVRVSDDDKRDTHDCKIDLRFTTDLADVGPPVENH